MRRMRGMKRNLAVMLALIIAGSGCYGDVSAAAGEQGQKSGISEDCDEEQQESQESLEGTVSSGLQGSLSGADGSTGSDSLAGTGSSEADQGSSSGANGSKESAGQDSGSEADGSKESVGQGSGSGTDSGEENAGQDSGSGVDGSEETPDQSNGSGTNGSGESVDQSDGSDVDGSDESSDSSNHGQETDGGVSSDQGSSSDTDAGGEEPEPSESPVPGGSDKVPGTGDGSGAEGSGGKSDQHSSNGTDTTVSPSGGEGAPAGIPGDIGAEGGLKAGAADGSAEGEAAGLQVPQQVSLVIDPWEIDGRGQVYSDQYTIKNNGDTAVKLDLYGLACRPGEQSGVNVKAGREGIHESDTKSIYVEMVFSNGDSVIFQEEESQYSVELAPGEELVFWFCGEVNVNAVQEWRDSDIEVTILYQWDDGKPGLATEADDSSAAEGMDRETVSKAGIGEMTDGNGDAAEGNGTVSEGDGGLDETLPLGTGIEAGQNPLDAENRDKTSVPEKNNEGCETEEAEII